ncbi:SDR family NAD(P)-dependent oxidoreductase [Ruegeria marina]|uniref:Gluconate 5-dehydrogenase n=1 Tax=Ruegeria marina TaxID=639004 RepID=A0A1G6TDQ9_9RHOB|nr:SDR family oxidoreductase [Ruegeria marina]SDD27193.1 gluconate 5-dehydrogenase [Ruegeria marina]
MFDQLAPSRLFSLEGRVALITGAAGGIASGVAEAFAAAGARLVLADLNEKVHARAQALREAGAEVQSLTFDVNDAEAAGAAVNQAAGIFGRLDILVNNAAVIVRKPFLELEQADWRKVIDTDLNAYFTVAQAAARIMVERGAGRIINMGSIMGHVSRPNLVPYVSAKGAVHSFAQAVAADLAGTGVTVNVLAPGYTITEFSQANVKEFHDFVRDWTPCRRWGKPQDIAGAALLLASDAGAYINGQVIYIDGGFTAVTR